MVCPSLGSCERDAVVSNDCSEGQKRQRLLRPAISLVPIAAFKLLNRFKVLKCKLGSQTPLTALADPSPLPHEIRLLFPEKHRQQIRIARFIDVHSPV
jgi:hypothetical protein